EDEARHAVAKPQAIERLGGEPARSPDDDRAVDDAPRAPRLRLVEGQQTQAPVIGSKRQAEDAIGGPGDCEVDDEGARRVVEDVSPVIEDAARAEEGMLEGEREAEEDDRRQNFE